MDHTQRHGALLKQKIQNRIKTISETVPIRKSSKIQHYHRKKCRNSVTKVIIRRPQFQISTSLFIQKCTCPRTPQG